MAIGRRVPGSAQRLVLLLIALGTSSLLLDNLLRLPPSPRVPSCGPGLFPSRPHAAPGLLLAQGSRPGDLLQTLQEGPERFRGSLAADSHLVGSAFALDADLVLKRIGLSWRREGGRGKPIEICFPDQLLDRLSILGRKLA